MTPLPPAPEDAHAPTPPRAPGKVLEVLLAFLKLGLTAFGGPVAHLAHFRTEFVARRGWLDDGQYTALVALCQFLPGPASSQVGVALGLARAGGWGALAAWVGFTLPSALLMGLLALSLGSHAAWAQSGAVHGLKVAAVAVVAQAVWAMGRSLCRGWPRASLALATAVAALSLPAAWGPWAAIVLGAAVGRCLLPAEAAGPPPPAVGVSRRTGAGLLLLALALLVGLPAWAAASGSPAWAAVAGVYQAGALVFGGGHVVLPLLQAAVLPTDAVAPDTLLAGYAAAQAVPGPLFTFAAFLGTALTPPLGGWLGGAWGGLVLLLAVFLPGVLLVVGALPFWARWGQHPGLRRAMGGIQAAVVGLLAATLVHPVGTGSLHSLADGAAALLAWALLVGARLSPVWVVLGAAVLGGLFSGAAARP